jgi:hypothetical protein
MTLGSFVRGVLFCAGMVTGATSGNLFYLERYMAGIAILGLTATFLFFAMSDLTYYRRDDDDELAKGLAEQRQALSALGLLMADDAIDGFKRIGRSMPGTHAELNKLEDELRPLLNSLKVPRKERERIFQEIDKLRTRSRQDEGRRALTGGKV